MSVIYKEASSPARESPENGTVSFKVSGELLILMSEHLTTNNNPSFRIGVRLWTCLLLGTLVNTAMAQGKNNYISLIVDKKANIAFQGLN